MPELTPALFSGPEGGYIVLTWDAAAEVWRYRPVMAGAALNVADLDALGLLRAIDPEPLPLVGIPLMVDVVMAVKNTDKAWYEATRVFGPYNVHPDKCEDWNLETGGNTDLGEPLVAPFSGLVLAAYDYGGGRGKIVQILGRKRSGAMIAWAGWHLEDMDVIAGDIVSVGDDIGTIGNADGRYKGAHLHEQIAIVGDIGIPSPAAFASDSRYNWQQPSVWYVDAGVDADLVQRMTEKDGE